MTTEKGENPYRAPLESGRFSAPLGAARVVQVERAWWRRRLHVEVDAQIFDVQYSARGFGYEQVLVDGIVADRRSSWFWFAPHFEFRLDHYLATIDVRVGPSLRITEFRFAISGVALYEEGNSLARAFSG